MQKKYAASIRDIRRETQKLERKARQKERLLEQKAAQIKQIANNYGQLQELKLAQQLLKFNPIIKEKILQRILKEKNEFSIKDSVTSLAYSADLAESTAAKVEKASFEKRLANIKKRNALVRRLLKVPYTNSIPALLKRLDSLNKNINQSYEKLWQSLYTQLQSKQEKLDTFQYGLEYYMEDLKKRTEAIAYVIDARDLQNVYLHVDKNAKIR